MKLKKLLAVWIAAFIMATQFGTFAAEDAERIFSVTAVTPYDGAKNISPVNLKMDITFSEPVDPATLTMTSVSVSGGAFRSVKASGENTAVLYFSRDHIALGEKYTVTLKNSIKAKSGASLEEKKITFTVSKEAPAYRQITNQDLSDADFLSGFGGDTVNNISITSEDGNNVLKFITPGWNEAAVKQKAYIEGGRTYVGNVRVKTETAQKIWLALYYVVPGDANTYHDMVRKEISANTWTTIETSWNIPDNVQTDDVVVMVAVQNPETVTYIDDWHFYELGNDEDPPKDIVGGSGALGYTYLSQTNTAMDRAKAFGIIAAGASEKSTFSRYEFAKTLLQIVGIGDMTENPAPVKFEDVSESQSGVVAAVTAAGLMNGCSDTAFEPDAEVTFDQALKMLLTLMGWSSVAEDSGGYPAGYQSVAAHLGLLQDISARGDMLLSCSDFALLIDHALTTEVLTAKVYHHSMDSYEKVRGSSFLKTFFGYESGRGKIEGTATTYLYQESDLKKGQAFVDGRVFQCDADLDAYLGYDVTYYYEKSNDSLYDKLIYIGGLSDGNRVVTFSTFDDKVDYQSDRYSVSSPNSRKDKVYALDPEKDVIYNGKYLGSYQDNAETFVPDYGTIQLVDSGNGFETVVITDIQTMLVSSVDYQNQIIYGQDGDTPITLSDCENPVIWDVDETSYRLKDIKKGTVVSAIISKDKKQALLYLSERSVSGPLCEIRPHDLSTDLVIGDRFYGGNVRETYGTVNRYFNADNLSLGVLGTFYLDYRGKVAGFEIGSAIDGVGYLVDAVTVSSGFTKKAEFKIFDASDQLVYLKGNDKIKIDNITVKKADDVLDILKKGTGEVVSQLILYKTDAEGQVVSIDTAYNKQPGAGVDYRAITPPAEEDEDSFRVTFSGILPTLSDTGSLITADRTTVCNPYTRSFENKVLLQENPTIFIVPRQAKDAEDEMFIMSGSAWDVGDNNAAKIESYNCTGDSLTADYLVVYTDPGAYGTHWMDEYKFGLVTERKNIIKDGEPVEEIILDDGSSRYTEDAFMLNGVEVGDYIKFCQDKKNYITRAAVVLFDAAQRIVHGGNPNAGWNDYTRMIYAGVYDKKDSVMKVVPSTNNPAIDFSEENLLIKGEIVNCSGAKTYLYDSEKHTLSPGSLKEVLDYQSAGEGYSNVLVISEKNYVRIVVIME